jgi:hypothetical protein
VERAFRLAYGRPPEEKEKQLALAHLEKLIGHHRRTPPRPKAERKPIVHTITSELTGENFRFVQREDPVEFEDNLHPSDAPPETRALADLALVLMNSNEFVYIY